MSAFDKFRSSLNYSNGGELKLKFPAHIHYTSPKVTTSSSSEVTLYFDTMGYGKVSIGENADLDTDTYHLDFTPHYQSYSYQNTDGQNKLVIEGNSPKMNGEYKVTITEK
nr:hypothetical protein [uncultured Pseudodesulfovibrio sp.]